jgi:hypothetical protein
MFPTLPRLSRGLTTTVYLFTAQLRPKKMLSFVYRLQNTALRRANVGK